MLSPLPRAARAARLPARTPHARPGRDPYLFMSSKAILNGTKAIRGGGRVRSRQRSARCLTAPRALPPARSQAFP